MTQALAERTYAGREGLAPGRLEFSGWKPYSSPINPSIDVHTIQLGGREFDVLVSYTNESGKLTNPFIEGAIPHQERIETHGFYLEGPVPHALRPLVRTVLESSRYEGSPSYPENKG